MPWLYVKPNIMQLSFKKKNQIKSKNAPKLVQIMETVQEY